MTFPKKTIHPRQTRYGQCQKRFHQVQAGEPVSLLGLLTGRQKGRCTPLGNLGPAVLPKVIHKSMFSSYVSGKGCKGVKVREFLKSLLQLGMDMQTRLALNLQFCCHWWYKPQSPAINYKVMLMGHIWWGFHACDHSHSDSREQSMIKSDPEETATQ